MQQFNILGTAACALVLASCVTTGGDTPRLGNMLGDATGQSGRACIKVSDIQGYGVLQDNVISIEGEGEHYLATVTADCDDLPNSASLLFTGDFGEVCGQAMDEIVMDDNRCTINQLFEFDDRDDAMDAYHATLERRNHLNDSQPTG